MAGKNDCGMAGKGWRETGGGKRVAGNGCQEHMAGKGCAEYVKVLQNKQPIVQKKMLATHQSAHSKPSRPTAGLSANCKPTGPDLVADSPIGQQQADGPPVGLLWADWAQSACSGPTVYYF